MNNRSHLTLYSIRFVWAFIDHNLPSDDKRIFHLKCFHREYNTGHKIVTAKDKTEYLSLLEDVFFSANESLSERLKWSKSEMKSLGELLCLL